MTHLPHRRILTFPAIHPCEAISPSTLLTSLIDLSRDILAHRSSSFPVHRFAAREAIRQVSATLEFLEDLCCRCSPLPDSVVVAFSELHVTFQKLRLLLHDCSRRGARLWILMKSDRVACEFRMLFRSIATVLDVVPLESIDASGDMKEVVRMVARQAWGVMADADAADARAARGVRSVLKSLGVGEWPARHFIERVMDHLRIRSWADCNDEVSFLESEISSSSDGKEGEISLLSSLMGFMVYCRVVFFDATAVSDRKRRHEDTKLQEAAMQHVNPDDLRCPISLELMTDPVTVSTGQTYDRRSITRWLDAGCLTCPVTGDKLANTKLVPNAALRNLVEHFRKLDNMHPTEPSSRKRDLSRTVTTGSATAAGAIRMAANFLVEKLTVGSREEQAKAAYEIRLLTKSSLFNRSTVVESGSVQCLLSLISPSSDAVAQDHAVAALLNISKLPLGRLAIFEYGGLRPILDVLNSGLKIEAQQNAAAILFYLSSVDEYRREIGEAREAIPALVELLRSGTYRGKKNAAVALFGLLLFPGNHSRVFAAGCLPAILDIMLGGERDDLVTDSVAILAKLAERPEGANIILRSSAVPFLVEVLRTSPSRSGKEYCVATLWSLSNNGGAKVARVLDGQPSLMSSLYSLLTDGTPHAAKKARSLLNYLHKFQDDGCSAMTVSPTVGDHYFVHAQ